MSIIKALELRKSITAFRICDPYMPSQQIDILLALYINQSPMRSADLQARCSINKQSMSRHLTSLEEKGLVSMAAADATDLRTKDILLTGYGREIVEIALE
jgi:DNA-binding MarR family transcriptional regulator